MIVGSWGWVVICWVFPVEMVKVWGRGSDNGCTPPRPGVGTASTVGMDMGMRRGGLRCRGMEWLACC